MTYRGGKGSLFRQLINLIPNHETYIEPYLGMGAVMRNKRPARRSIGVEIDRSIVAQWCGDEITNLSVVKDDALNFLRSYEWTGAEFVYADPPYLPSTRRMERVYRFDCDESHHLELLSLLNTLPVLVMLSGYASPLYDDTLRDWNRLEFQTGSHGSARTEVVWLNYEPPAVPFDTRFTGDTFRERQRIQRKQQRLRKKIMDLPCIERHLLLGWLTEALPGACQSHHGQAV